MGAPAETDQPATTPDADTTTWGTIGPAMSDEDMGKAIRQAYINWGEDAVTEFSFSPDYPNKDLQSFKQFLSDTLFIETNDNAYLQRFETIKARVVEEIGPKMFPATQRDIAGYVHQGVEPDNIAQPGVLPNSAAPDKVAKAADPVCLFNGNFLYTATDLQLDGAGIQFMFTRTYSQLSRYNGPLGYKWDHCYNLWIRVSDDPNLLYRSTGALREETYRRHTQLGYWIPPPGATGIIEEQGGSFVLSMPDGSRLVYEPHTQLHLTIHVVSSIEDRFGNFLRFRYRSDGLLATVTVNHPDRIVNFIYDTENRIIALHDFSGRRWRYLYDDLGDMIAVTTPATESFRAGTTTVFEYSSAAMADPSAQHNLITITDPQGYPFLENEYGTEKNLLSYNRVIRQRQGQGDIIFEYADVIETFGFPYAEHERPVCQTILTERDGKQTRYLFNRLGNMIFREEYARLNGIPKLVSSHYRYNSDGNLTGMISNLGVITQYLYGRDYFEKRFPPPVDYQPAEDPNLTASVRQHFPHLLAIVSRRRYYSFSTLSMALGLWSDSIFPDIYATGPDDIIQKFSYEPGFFQLLTVSDPRFTDSADPDSTESPAYFSHLTTFGFQAHDGVDNFHLSSQTLPAVLWPDGSAADPVVTRFTAYDPQGRLLQTIAPNGLEIQNAYFDMDTREGFLKDTTLDSAGLHIRAGVERDGLGRVIQVNSPGFYSAPGDRFCTRNVFNDLGQLVRTTTTAPFSVVAEYRYNRAGNLVRSTIEQKDDDNLLTGHLANSYRFDTEFNLLRQDTGKADGAVIKRSRNVYDRAGRIAVTISPSGYKTRTRYNERGLLSQTIEDYGGVHAITRNYFDADGRVIRTVDATGHAHRFTYDTSGRPVLTEDPMGNKVVRHFDKAGNLLAECFFELQGAGFFRLLSRKAFVYDAIGRRIRSGVNKFEAAGVPLIPEAQLLSAFVISGPGELLETQLFYNAIGQVVKLVDPSQRVFQAEFDILGRLVKRIDPFGHEISYAYDSESNVVRVDRKELTRDKLSNAITGERYFRETAAYDELNRLVRQTDSLGNTSQWKYDSGGNRIKQIDPLGNIISTDFDEFSRPVRISQPLHHYLPGEVPELVETQFRYYQHDRLHELTDALGRKTIFEYDSAERLTATLLPDGTRDRVEYNRSNQMVQYRDRNETLHHFSFDALGRNIALRIEAGAAAGFSGDTLLQTDYDGIGRVVRVAHDRCETIFGRNSLGWITEEATTISGVPGVAATGSLLQREFNNSGMQTALVHPSGRRIEYSRDLLDRIVAITQTASGAGYPGSAEGAGGGMIAEIEYEGYHRKRVHRSNGSSTDYTWDAGSRVTAINHRIGSQDFLTLQFLYDALGNMRQQTERSDEHAHTAVFRYDSLSRLTGMNSLPPAALVNMQPFEPDDSPLGTTDQPDFQATMNSLLPADDPAVDRSYAYDAVGNRTSVVNAGGGSQSYFSNELDQYRQLNGQLFTYDTNGNLREDDGFTYAYNHLNQLSRVRNKTDNTETEYLYDPFGRRFAEIRNGVARTMAYDGQRLLEEYVNGALQCSHAGEPADDTPLVSARAGKESHLYPDLGKSVRHVYENGTKANYYRYDEFGNTVQSLQPGDDNLFRYGGKRLLMETGRYDFIFRTYDPEQGRFLQRDPKGFADGTNPYTYVKNNPLVHTDPLGMETRPETGFNPFVKNFVGAFRAANTPIDINGKPLKGPYNLWSDIAGGGYAKAKAAPGWIMEQTPQHVIAEAAQRAHPNNATQNIPPGDWDDIWGKPSRSLARRAVISGKPIASFGLDTHQNPQTTMQYQHEIPTVGRWGYFTGGSMKLGGLLNLWSAAQSDNDWIKTLGIIGGSSEILGGTLYMAGAATMHTRAMMIGSGISRFIGGPTTILLSGYAFYNDIRNGNYLDAVGSGSGVLAGGAMVVGWTTGTVFFGSFAGGWSLGRYIDKKTGWSTSLSNRASRNRDIYREELGLGETSSTILGGAANIPVLSEIGQGIGWGAYKLYEADRWVADKMSSAYDSVTDYIGYELCMPFVSCD